MSESRDDNRVLREALESAQAELKTATQNAASADQRAIELQSRAQLLEAESAHWKTAALATREGPAATALQAQSPAVRARVNVVRRRLAFFLMVAPALILSAGVAVGLAWGAFALAVFLQSVAGVYVLQAAWEVDLVHARQNIPARGLRVVPGQLLFALSAWGMVAAGIGFPEVRRVMLPAALVVQGISFLSLRKMFREQDKDQPTQ